MTRYKVGEIPYMTGWWCAEGHLVSEGASCRICRINALEGGVTAFQALYSATSAALQDDCLPLGSHCRLTIETAHLEARNALIALGENPDA